jgi:hypothetical protein
MRGWSGLHCNAVATLIVRHDPETGARTLVLKKVKNGKDGKKLGFTLKTVPLGEDEDGDPVESCVPVYGAERVETDADQRRRELTPRGRKVQIAFNRLLQEGPHSPAPDVPGVRPGTRAVSLIALREKAFALGLFAAEAPGPDADELERTRFRKSRNKAFSHALNELERKGLLRTELDLVWDPDGPAEPG